MSTTAPSLMSALMDRAVRADPYPLYARMRERAVSVEPDGTFVIARYEHVHALLRDPRICSDLRKSDAGFPIPGGAAPSFLLLDPPDHTRIRSLVVREFRPAIVARLRTRVEDVVCDLIDGVRGQATFDLVAAVAHPLPVTVICELLGVPREDEPRFATWSDAMARSLDGRGLSGAARDEIAVRRDEMIAYMSALVAARRETPGEDYLSLLLAAEQDGERLSAHEVIVTLGLLLVAGHETTVNLIANAMLALLRDPALLARVQADPALAGAIVDETLRHDTPVHWRMRTCSEDIEVAGTTIPRGATIALMLASANRDPAFWPDADRFDPGRATHGHLGFGGGPHYCAGAGLARLESQIAVAELVRRLRDPALVIDPPPYRRNAALRGPERLAVAVGGVVG